MSVLAVIGSTGNFGGAEATDIHYVARLVADGVQVHWAMPAEGTLRAHLEEVGVRCEVVASPPVLDGMSRRYVNAGGLSALALAAGGARYAGRLTRWLRDVRPDGVLATGFRAQLAVTPIAAAMRVPLAWVASDFVPVGPPACRLWSALARRAPRLILTYSTAAASQPALAGATRVVPVLSGVDLDGFPPGPAGREPLLVLIGHLTPLKNHLGFLDVLAQVRRSVPEAEGVLVGADIYRTAGHEAYVAGVREAVAGAEGASLAALSEEEVAALLRRCALLVHLSDVPETFGRVLAEAMASGAVVVGFDRGATPEVVGDAGVVVAAGDLTGVARACTDLLRDDDRRQELARRGRERAERCFDVERAGREGAAAITAALGLRTPVR